MFELIIFGLAVVVTYNTAGPILFLKGIISKWLNKKEYNILSTMINCETCSSFHLGWMIYLLYPFIPMFLQYAIILYAVVVCFMYLYYKFD